MATYRQLTAQLERLQQKIDKEREKAIADAIADIRAKIEEYDITPEELGFRAAGRRLPPRSRSVRRRRST
ncbi:H-NS histone family [Burkholderia cepacia]|nr:H-NS histone family [Burkholderia cepacia]